MNDSKLALYQLYLSYLLTRSRQEITYKFFSVKTLKHSAWYFAPWVILCFLSAIPVAQDQQDIAIEVMAGENVIDQMSQYIVIMFSALWSFFPFLIASGLPIISELAFASDLKFPKNGGSILLSMAFIVALQVLGEF